MPVEFLTAEQEKRYGRFAGEPTQEQLQKYFHLDAVDRLRVSRKHGAHNKLGFAVQLGTVRFLGTFLARPIEVPAGVANFLAAQLEIADPACLLRYSEDHWWIHVREICKHYSYRELADVREVFQLTRWMYARAWGTSQRPSVLFDLATARLVERKVLLPGVTTLARLVARVRERVEARLWRCLSNAVTPEERGRLESLLIVPEGAQSNLERLRRPPTRVTSAGLIGALERIREICALDVGRHDLARVPANRLAALVRLACTARSQAIARMPDQRRIATLVAFAGGIEVRAIDDSLDLLDLLLKKISSKAERLDSEERLRTRPALEASALRLAGAMRIFLERDRGRLSDLRGEIFEHSPPDLLLAAVESVEKLARSSKRDRSYYEHFIRRYQVVRRFLPLLLDTLCFEGNEAAQPLLEAWKGLASLADRKRLHADEVALDVVAPAWRRYVEPRPGTVERRAYTLSVVEGVWEGLLRRDIFVPKSEHYGDPRAQLLQGEAWRAARPNVCRALNLPSEPEPFLKLLREELEQAYRRTGERLSVNDAARIVSRKKRDRVALARLDALEEPESLVALRTQVSDLLPRVDLPDVLLEVDAWTKFTDEFTHVSERNARVEDLGTSVCAVLLAEACNVGLEPVTCRSEPALTPGRLGWVDQNYIRAETLRRANTRLVDYQSDAPLALHWGNGEVASADGMRFTVPVHSIHAGPNPKYFDVEKGVTYYNFLSSQFAGFHAIVIPGTIRDAIYILEGLLEQESRVHATRLMSDTAGYSDLIFGLFRLLGYRFSPRIARLSGTRFWRMDPQADYGPLNGIARNRIRTALIASHWEDILRVAGSLSQSKVSASELVRTLQAGGRQTTLARAIAAIGRQPKTVHLLSFVDDETYRRETLVQLNRQETRHSLGRAVFHGQRGELRQRYREGQEDQLGSLGLVLNAIAVWNTRYMDAALSQLRAHGFEVRPEDVARLSPLGYEHINLLGRYSFGLPPELRRGELRPLRDHKGLAAWLPR
jgi:TnpA family transposase